MVDKDEIKRLSNIYISQSTVMMILLQIVGEVVGRYFDINDMIGMPCKVSAIFCIVTGIIIGWIWRWVATNNEEMLTTFYSSTNAFRMLLALATLTGCYFVVGSENIRPYVIVFMVFYLIAVAHHAIYFARITNKK